MFWAMCDPLLFSICWSLLGQCLFYFRFVGPFLVHVWGFFGFFFLLFEVMAPKGDHPMSGSELGK